MKTAITILIISIASMIKAQDGTATTIKKTFSRTTSISKTINASPEKIWSLLTDSGNMAKWNSTIISIDGEIKVGEKIKLVSYLDPSRTFKIKVKQAEANKKMTWGDAIGERVFLLTPSGNETRFTMTEKIGGLMFPLFASKIPPFDESFEKFAADLKKAAEM